MNNLIDSNHLLPEPEDARYVDSIFRHFKALGAKQKGKRGEIITRDVLSKLNFLIESPVSTDHDMILDGVKCEIKSSTLGKNTENFSFLQIRPDQDYDKLIFSMFYPDELVIMSMEKSDVLRNIEEGVFKKQHGGNKAESRTFLYYGNFDTLKTIGAKEIIRCV